jgi:hypothetical protein
VARESTLRQRIGANRGVTIPCLVPGRYGKRMMMWGEYRSANHIQIHCEGDIDLGDVVAGFKPDVVELRA